jgi:hypothetical protein
MIDHSPHVDRAAKARSARAALVRWSLALLILVIALSLLNLHRRPIDYSHADGAQDAFGNASIDDTRYLCVQVEFPAVPLLPNLAFSPDEPLEPGRDVRLIPAAPAGLYDKQREYLMSYNGVINELLRTKQRRGQPVRRPAPLSAPEFVMIAVLTAAPFFLHLYLQYRLGPYRLDGRLWTHNLWSDDTWDYMRPATYSDGAQFLLMLLWIDTALIVPWVLEIVSLVHHRPLP